MERSPGQQSLYILHHREENRDLLRMWAGQEHVWPRWMSARRDEVDVMNKIQNGGRGETNDGMNKLL